MATLRVTTTAVLALLLIAAAGGCAQYEYSIVEPAQRQPIFTEKQLLAVSMPPLDYSFGRGDDRLAVRIANPTTEVIYLIGSRSYVVDTLGQSHPLPSRTIAPHSYIVLQIPPPRPTYWISPYYGVGYDYPFYGWDTDRMFYPAPPPPAYVQVMDLNPYYWEWDGPGQFRLQLAYRREGSTFENRFVFLRRKL